MYKLSVLSSKDFDDLPEKITRGSNISMSLGFANPFRNEAYVRHTAWPELTRYLMDHELEHLIEEHATDEDENGIRHKSVGQIFQHLINPLNFSDPISQAVHLTDDNRGIGQSSKEGGFNKIASPIGNAFGNAAEGFFLGGPAGAIGSGIQGFANNMNPKKPQMGGGFQGQGQGPNSGFAGLFQGGNPQSSAGAFSPSGIGPQGGQGAQMSNMGLGAGLPNNASISMGQQNGPEQQKQSGYFYPSFRF